ncbi:hypothetical protein BJ988_005368 [Nocardioides panzhihuensis]|uniref:Uncharacterized protein n=1 Tax=Nocardioides panzhihuensis TaxID=860243 RepID=A0A7Z0IV68_9ACTN|nr:hypothetical protein [Nocardioides panzhihuensis]
MAHLHTVGYGQRQPDEQNTPVPAFPPVTGVFSPYLQVVQRHDPRRFMPFRRVRNWAGNSL